MTLLIADDSEAKTIMMQGMLHRAQWKGDIFIASDTDEAKKLIDTHDIQFAFIDFYIPEENGPAVIKYLKDKNPTARIALVSSSDNMQNFDEAKAAGAELCICSSYPADEVEKSFMDILEEWKEARS